MATHLAGVLADDLKDLEGELEAYRRRVREEREALASAETGFEAQKGLVRQAMGGSGDQPVGEKPPKALVALFKQHGIPDGYGLWKLIDFGQL